MKEAIEYSVRRSDRARNVRVEVAGDGNVEVVLPRRAPARAAAAAVGELRGWIESRRAELLEARAHLGIEPGRLPYLDERLLVVGCDGRTRAHRRGSELLVPEGPQRLRAIESWYRRAARVEIAARLDGATARAGLSYRRLSIRNQRTRWASCATDGSMSFNWRLLLAPERVLDYVVWHEVCHLEVADHSVRFWARLERVCPDWREPAAWLRRNGHALTI